MGSIKSKRKTYRDYLWYVAFGVFVICIVEGILYYHDTEDIRLKILLNIQNAIKAYKIDPDIKLKEALAFLDASDSAFEIIVGYLYCLAIIVAPFCTVAGLTLLVQTYVGFRKGKSARKGRDSIIVIGEGAYKKNFIRAFSKSGAEYRVYTVEKAPLAGESKVKFLSAGMRVVLDYEDGHIVESAKMSGFDSILLCDDDPFKNLTLLNEILEKDYFRPNQKIYFVSCVPGISEIVKKKYDEWKNRWLEHETAEWAKKNRDELDKLDEAELSRRKEEHQKEINPAHFPLLYIFNPKKKAAEKLLKDEPITDYVDKPYDVHIGILGFGDFGQNFLLSAVPMSVMAAESRIIFDVYDSKIDKILPVFLTNFSSKILGKLNKKDGYYEIEIKAEEDDPFDTDGSLVLRFFNADADTIQFTALLEKNATAVPYDYFVVALDTDIKTVSVVTELARIISLNAKPALIIRAKDNDLVLDIESGNDKVVRTISIKEDEKIYSYDSLINNEIVKRAIEFHREYNELAGFDGTWNETDFYGRESSMAQSMHQPVKEILCKKGGLDREDMEKIEHRRWNYYMITTGKANEKGLFGKNLERNLHDCIVSFERLKIRHPEKVRFDYVPWQMLGAKEDAQEKASVK